MWAIGDDPGTLEDVNEPYLIMQGYIKRTPQGRVALPLAYRKLGITAPHEVGVYREELWRKVCAEKVEPGAVV